MTSFPLLNANKKTIRTFAKYSTRVMWLKGGIWDMRPQQKSVFPAGEASRHVATVKYLNLAQSSGNMLPKERDLLNCLSFARVNGNAGGCQRCRRICYGKLSPGKLRVA